MIHRTLRYLIPVLLLTVSLGLSLQAQENDKVQWKLLTPSISGTPGKTVVVKVQAVVAPKSHIYSTKKYPADKESPQSTEVTVGEKNLVQLGGSVKGDRPPHKYKEPMFDSLETEYWEGTVTFNVPVRIARNAAPGKGEGWTNFYFATCDDRSCRPAIDKKFTFSVEVLPDTAKKSKQDSIEAAKQHVQDSLAEAAMHRQDSIDKAAKDSALAHAGKDTSTKTAATAPVNNDTATKITAASAAPADDEAVAAKKKGLWSFILYCMGGGLLSIFMPCVYPIIPITVSFFTKRNHATHAHAIKDASFYGLGIVLTFVVVGVLVSVLFGGAALNEFVAKPGVNLTIGALFVVLALSLFGLYEIQLPTSWVNALNRSANAKGDSVGGVMLMGMVFALTSFSCTGAVIAGLLGLAANGDWTWAAIGMTAFAVVFALPFVIFALFPSMLKSVPKAGGWMNSIKVVLGFLEIAAAVKYFSNADIYWRAGIFTREVALAVWIAVAILTTMYLLGRFRLPHDTPSDHIGVVRAMFALAFASVALWMGTGLFGGKLGELDAILPPQYYPTKGNTSILGSLQAQPGVAEQKDPDLVGVEVEEGWIKDNLSVGLKIAKKKNKAVFVDFTGYQCTNCRWMEKNMFPDQDVKDLMEKYVLVRLYTDQRDSTNQANRKMEYERFGTIAMPYYVVISSADQVLGKFPGMTRDKAEFVTFLKTGLDKHVAMK